MISFMYDAPSDPHTDTTSGFSGSSPSWRLASALEQAVNAPRTGRASDDDLVLLAVVLLALLEADQNTVDRSGKHLRRQAGYGVGLMHDGRNAELRRRLEHGVAHIAARADGEIGLKSSMILRASFVACRALCASGNCT